MTDDEHYPPCAYASMVIAGYDGKDPDIGPARYVVAGVAMREHPSWIARADKLVGERRRGQATRSGITMSFLHGAVSGEFEAR